MTKKKKQFSKNIWFLVCLFFKPEEDHNCLFEDVIAIKSDDEKVNDVCKYHEKNYISPDGKFLVHLCILLIHVQYTLYIFSFKIKW